MRATIVALLVGLFVIGSFGSSQAGSRHHYRGNHHFLDWDDDVSFDLDDGTIIIEYDRGRRHREIVEITEDYELYIDGDRIDLDADQRALVREFHEQGMEIVDYAKEIGLEGAKIGVEGAKLGMRAIGCLFKLLSPGYDSDDMEYEMERAAEEIEDRAEELEDRAELIEDMAEDLEYIAEDMRDAIPELDRLGWF